MFKVSFRGDGSSEESIPEVQEYTLEGKEKGERMKLEK